MTREQIAAEIEQRRFYDKAQSEQSAVAAEDQRRPLKRLERSKLEEAQREQQEAAGASSQAALEQAAAAVDLTRAQLN